MITRWEIIEDLIKKNGYKKVAEIGVYLCSTAKYLLKNCQLDNYFLIDTVENKSILDLISQYDNCFFINDFSSKAAERFDDESIDLVFIDACHEYDSIKEDIKSWYPKVRKGGIISGHDYGPAHMGVMKAVLETFKSFDLKIDKEITDTLIAVWWSYKE